MARRQWRKLHVGVDDDGFIVAAKLTKSSEDDPSTVPCLLGQVDSPIRRFTADGAYDTRSVYELLGEVGTEDIKIVIPPRRGAVPSDGAEARRRSGTRPWRRFAMSGGKAGSGSHAIDDRAPSRIFSSGTSARSETSFARAATNRRSGRQGSGAMY